MQNDQIEKVTLFLEEFQVSNEFVRTTERREKHARACAAAARMHKGRKDHASRKEILDNADEVMELKCATARMATRTTFDSVLCKS